MVDMIADKIEHGIPLTEAEEELNSLDSGLLEDINHIVIAKELGVPAPSVWRLDKTEPGWILAAIVSLQAEEIVAERLSSRHRKGG